MANLGRIDEAFMRWQFSVSRRKQLDFLDGVLRLLTDGIPFSQACEYSRTVGSPVDRAVAKRMLRRLDEGGTVVDAMATLFPLDIVGAFGAAQQSGDLSETGMPVLERLRMQFDARQGVAGDLIKPGLYVLFALALYAVFALEIWPRFETTASREDWPAVAQISYRFGEILVAWWHAALVGIVALSIAVRLLLRRYAGRGRRLLDRLWPFTVYRELRAANALEELGTLLTAGREPGAALDTVSAHATPHVNMYVDRMKRRLDEGRNLAEVLDVGFIANRHIARLKLLAGYRNLRQTIMLTGAAARDAVLAHVRHTANALFVAGISIFGAVLGSLIISVYLTMTGIATNVAS